MKTRFGFVSNSSSSSFILPVDGNSQEVTVTIPLSELTKMFDSDGETTIRKIIRTEEGLKDYICDEWGLDYDTFFVNLSEDDYLQDMYNDILEMIGNNKIVLLGCVDDYDIGLENMLKKLGAKIND